MPVFLFTFHAYRSWTEDNPRGYVQRGKPGVQPPNPRLAKHRAAIAKHPPVEFDDPQRNFLIDESRAICQEHGWRPHAAAVTPSHVHLLVSWRSVQSERELSTLFKRQLGRRLSHDAVARGGSMGNRWFSRGCDETPVTDRDHFDYLISTYLPKHIQQRGVFWSEHRM